VSIRKFHDPVTSCREVVRAALSARLTVALAAVALAAVPPAAAQTVVGDRRPELVASYEIRARLDAGEHRIDGSETIHWRNPSRRPATELCFHLYLNAFRNSASTWLRHEGAEQIAVLEPDGWGVDRAGAAGGRRLRPARPAGDRRPRRRQPRGRHGGAGQAAAAGGAG
jgi:hypothetical protein